MRLDRDRQHDLLEAVGDLRLVVVELDDIGILFGEDARDVEQLARLVRQLDGEAEDAAACNQGLVDERRDGRDVDVAARDDGDDLFALEGELRERGEREYTGALRDKLVLLNQREQCVHNVDFRDRDDVVEVFLAKLERQRAGRLDGATVSDCVGRGERHDLIGLERRLHAGRVLRLDADDLDVRIDELRRKRDARSEAAAANRAEDRVDVLERVDDLERRRALAEQDLQVVERMDVDVAVLLLEFEAVRVGIIEAVTMQHDFCAERARALDLEDRRRRRHADDGLDAELLRCIGHALRVVAGRSRDDALRALLRRELADLVVGTAELEGTRMLKIFRLEVDIVVALLREEVTVDEPRLAGYTLELLGSAIDVGNRRPLHDFRIGTFGTLRHFLIFRHS